jgi:hypothetical protein
MTLAAFSAQPLVLDNQRIYTLARTITYKYVDVNENFSASVDARGVFKVPG